MILHNFRILTYLLNYYSSIIHPKYDTLISKQLLIN